MYMQRCKRILQLRKDPLKAGVCVIDHPFLIESQKLPVPVHNTPVDHVENDIAALRGKDDIGHSIKIRLQMRLVKVKYQEIGTAALLDPSAVSSALHPCTL